MAPDCPSSAVACNQHRPPHLSLLSTTAPVLISTCLTQHLCNRQHHSLPAQSISLHLYICQHSRMYITRHLCVSTVFISTCTRQYQSLALFLALQYIFFFNNYFTLAFLTQHLAMQHSFHIICTSALQHLYSTLHITCVRQHPSLNSTSPSVTTPVRLDSFIIFNTHL